MTSRRRLGLALVLGASLGSGACLPPQTVGQLAKLDIRRSLQSEPSIREATSRASALAVTLSSALLVLVAIHCGIKAHRADVRLWAVAQDYAVGVVVMVTLVGAWKAGGGPFAAIAEAGLRLGDRFAPTGDPVSSAWVEAARKAGELADGIGSAAGRVDIGTAGGRLIEALGYALVALPWVAWAAGLNTILLFVFRLVAQASYVVLMALYWMVGPLVAPFIALPQTRQVFYGWLKAFLAVSLWPLFFALMERVFLALPMLAFCGIGSSADPAEAVGVVLRSQIVFLAMNCVAAMSYLGIPVLAYLIVAGLGKPFRGMW